MLQCRCSVFLFSKQTLMSHIVTNVVWSVCGLSLRAVQKCWTDWGAILGVDSGGQLDIVVKTVGIKANGCRGTIHYMWPRIPPYSIFIPPLQVTKEFLIADPVNLGNDCWDWLQLSSTEAVIFNDIKPLRLRLWPNHHDQNWDWD